MTLDEIIRSPSHLRDVDEWVQLLNGPVDDERRRIAAAELNRALTMAAYRCIYHRRTTTSQLDGWSESDVLAYQQEVVEATIQGLAQDEYRALRPFGNVRAATAYAAQLVIDRIATALGSASD